VPDRKITLTREHGAFTEASRTAKQADAMFVFADPLPGMFHSTERLYFR
jgi:hypothetical protein